MPSDDYYKTVFKSPSTKVVRNRNKNSACGYTGCKSEESAGRPRFPVCASCKHTRYCSREHQVAAWKSHKAQCKRYQERDEAEGIRAALGLLTPHQIVDNLLEDFVHLHESTFDELANFIYHVNLPKLLAEQVDFSRVTVNVYLNYLPDCEGNPAKAFEIETIALKEVGSESLSEKVKKYRDDLKRSRQNDPTFIQGVLCSYHVAGYESPLQPTGLKTTNWVIIYKPHAQFKLEEEWNQQMLKMVQGGIVLRKVRDEEGPRKYRWVPGFLFKGDSKWTWKAIPPDLADRFSMNLPPVEYWGRQKITTFLYAPGATSAWVAPAGFLWESND
ncbi:hypothetical protein HYPSUDRAFT_72303 [Hypholoma sublateritium FD-334 SS-4]|uniref:MYND-type domain-containing protein n=1 Tax=Hypholoma sublateritium (strain FD-334 SS-4) TaxID=945553 RepID=A0A0D2NE58_HYPSF|nr:hypothetical protein HYPSUDRAFT_72303 [Hypholoma sublateritium FD-334 SS-4]